MRRGDVTVIKDFNRTGPTDYRAREPCFGKQLFEYSLPPFSTVDSKVVQEELEGLFLSLMVEKQYWIQSGLALSPLMGTCTQYSLGLTMPSCSHLCA